MSSRETARGPALDWSADHRAQSVAVVGATGAVGRELCQILLRAGHDPARIDASARANGSLRVDVGRERAPVELAVRAFEPGAASTSDLVFLCTPAEVSLDLAPRCVDRGARVVDLSSAFRMHAGVPLVVPEINGDMLSDATRLVANPNCTTAIACMPLAVVERVAGLDEVIVVSFQAASGAGVAGISTLELETREVTGAAHVGPRPVSPFPARLALNVIPAVADVDASGTSGEERKVVDETRRILRRQDLVVEVTTTRVPVERCHSVAVHARTQRDFDLAAMVGALRCAPGITVSDDPHGPRPREQAGLDPVAVGRIRAGTRGRRSLCFFAVGDQIRKGAALNALQIAARLPPAVHSRARPSQ